jgi:hypothetical protein
MKSVRWLLPVLAAGGLLISTPARADGAAMVSLHVDSPYVVEVERRDPGDKTWTPVCTNPCDIDVPVVGQYRVRGRGVTPSLPITLTPQGRSALLQVTPGSKDKNRTGWFVVSGGVAATIVGAALDVVGTGQGMVAGQGGPGDSGTTSSTKVNFYLAGTTLLIAGLATAFYGGALAYDNAHSIVRENDAPAPMRPPEVEATRDAVTRAAEAALASTLAVVVPLVSVAF